MTYLLSISIGPVQDFIAAARRTADLQAGSNLLVEIAKTIAHTLSKAGGELIFPASSEKDGKLDFSDGPNKILAVFDSNPADIAAEAERAAQTYLMGQWDTLKARIPGGALDEPLACSQIENFLEFYTAWVSIPSTPSGYAEARRDVDLLLAGRKALRDFAQPKHRNRRPKSPLDPSRDCVLHTNGKQITPKECQDEPTLRLKPSETLDAISLLKRIKGRTGQEYMPSTSQMAAQAILPQLEKEAGNELKALRALEKRAGASVDIGDLLFPGRLEEALEDLKDRQAAEEIKKAAPGLRSEALKKINRSECPPYYAILIADGDRMGKLLGGMQKREEHRGFSEKLSAFAEEAKAITKKHGGHPVYTGGDDVLALLPVNTALSCAAKLAQEFRDHLSGSAENGGTLSVGIAIVHCMEPLQVSLSQAREAEKAAKNNNRNSLAVALHTRGGAPLIVAHSWGDAPNIDRWNALTEALQSELARGFPYELHQLALELQQTDWHADQMTRRLPQEAIRILRRKKGGEQEDKAASLLEAALKSIPTAEELENFARQLVIARFLAGYPEVTHG